MMGACSTSVRLYVHICKRHSYAAGNVFKGFNIALAKLTIELLML